ncbi:MAG: pyruvate formate lyase family protein, partial [Candidatus Scatosoma sp.]
MLNNDQLSRIRRIKDFYMEEPVFKHHVGYTRVMRQRLNFMRAYVNGIGTEQIGPAVTPYNKNLLEKRPYTARLRLAYAEAAILNNMEPMIHDDELIVGRPDYTPLTEEETEEYKELETAMRGAPNTTYLTLGHMSLDYPKLLRVGINGLIAEVKARKDALDLNVPDNLSKYEFYEGCLTELESELTLQKRYAAKLKEKAEAATGAKKEHFKKLCEIVSRVPAQPARTFREALQAVHFFSFTLWELYYFGRIDQYLYPYYKADLEAGRITPDEALELMCCFLLMPDSYIMPNAAYDSMVGGKDKQGNVVENDITFMALDAAEIVKSGTGKVALAFGKDNSDKLLRRAIQVNATGASQPAIYNDDLITEGLIKMGVAPEDARYYCNTGCTEITPIGCSGIYPCAPYHNIANALLAAMRENLDATSTKPVLESFEKILHKEVQEQQLHINRRQMERSRNGGEPLRVSCLVDNCLSNGKAIDEGGAKYNHVMPTFVGVSNVVDSLMVIETLVFKEKKLTMRELLDVVDGNFENREDLRQYILNRIPHYGVNDKNVDKYAAMVS